MKKFHAYLKLRLSRKILNLFKFYGFCIKSKHTTFPKPIESNKLQTNLDQTYFNFLLKSKNFTPFIKKHLNQINVKNLSLIVLIFSCGTVLAENLSVQTPLETQTAPKLNFLSAILSASLIVQITFLILIIMSVVSWAIIFQKYYFFKEAKTANTHLKDVFLQDGSFEEIYAKARSNDNSSLAQIFISGYNEMQKILKTNSQNKSSTSSLKGLDNVERALRKACEEELSLLESSLGILATVGSSGPFIGLFGTVFGIMNSFNKIAVMGSASLNVVAPGIAEALLATGVGLFAAIPASIFYNSYLSELRKFDLVFNNFTADFLNIVKRNFFQDKE